MNPKPSERRRAILDCGGKRQRDTAFGLPGGISGPAAGLAAQNTLRANSPTDLLPPTTSAPPSEGGVALSLATALQVPPRPLASLLPKLAATLTLLTSATLADTPPDHDDPAAELASFKIAPGFQVSLFASEKDGIVKPIVGRFDRLGRLWVIGSTTYPQIKPGEVPNDYVKILEDTDGDGKVDKVTTFADGLLIPTGLEVDPDAHGCWVSEGTKLWHMRDEDGDGKADKKEIVLRGFGTGDNHQNINSFRWSPGGDLYMSQGLHGFARVETPFGITKLDEAGYYRFNPRRQQLDAFWGGPAEPQNPWGFVWDDWGNLFIQAGNNGGLFDALPSAFVGGVSLRPPSIWENARGRKSSNPAFVGTAHFPPDWQGALIVPGYINNAVWTLRLTPDGSGWIARDSDPLITSTHGSFRPMSAEFAPDGSLYLVDWYNPIIGHYQASFRHPDRDKLHGRIWRVTAINRPLVKPPEFLKKGYEADVKELLAGLESDERFVREHARQLLGTMPAERVLEPLDEWAKAKGTDRALFDALCVHQWRDVPSPEVLRLAFESKEPRLRAYTTQAWPEILADFGDGTKSMPFEPVFQKFLSLPTDEHPRVRLASMVAAANDRGRFITDYLTVIASREKPSDSRIDYARQQTILRLREVMPVNLKAVAAATPGWKDFFQKTSPPAVSAAPAPAADPKLAAMVAEAVKQPVGSGHLTPEAVAALAQEAREHGDAKHGRDVFRRAEIACTACHRIGDEGGQVGPDLSNVGSAQPIDFIIGAVFEPQREIKEGFETIQLQLKDGRTLTGFRRAAAPGEVAIFDAATQREVHTPKADVVSEKTLGSLMPTGLLDKLPREDQRDLFRYLSDLGKQH